MPVVQLCDAGCGVCFLKHRVTIAHRGGVVLEGAKGINVKLRMIRLSNEKPAAMPLSPTSVMSESANQVTADPWQDMHKSVVDASPNEQFIANVVHKPNEHCVANVVQIGTKLNLAKYNPRSLGFPQCQQ